MENDVLLGHFWGMGHYFTYFWGPGSLCKAPLGIPCQRAESRERTASPLKTSPLFIQARGNQGTVEGTERVGIMGRCYVLRGFE